MANKENWLRQYKNATDQFENWIEENGFPEKGQEYCGEYEKLVWAYFIEDTGFQKTEDMLEHVYEDVQKHVFQRAASFYLRPSGPYDKG